MGSKASKPVQTATRKFPSRSPGGAVPPRPSPKASFAKDDAIKADARDPDLDTDPNPLTNPAFSQRLRQMGVATPNPTLSRSSTADPFSPSPHAPHPSPSPSSPRSSYPSSPSSPPPQQQNRTLNALEARARLQRAQRAEFEDPSGGREFLDVGTLRRALALRARGRGDADIEARLRLKRGVVGRLGPVGVVLPVEAGVEAGVAGSRG